MHTYPNNTVDIYNAQELDAALEPILLQQKFKQGGQDMIRLGDNTVPYNEQFRLLMITKLPNPEYAPEVQVSSLRLLPGALCTSRSICLGTQVSLLMRSPLHSERIAL